MPFDDKTIKKTELRDGVPTRGVPSQIPVLFRGGNFSSPVSRTAELLPKEHWRWAHTQGGVTDRDRETERNQREGAGVL